MTRVMGLNGSWTDIHLSLASNQASTNGVSLYANLVFLIETCDKGYRLIHPLGRFSTHCCREFGIASRGKYLGELYYVDTMDVLPSDAFRQRVLCCNLVHFHVLVATAH